MRPHTVTCGAVSIMATLNELRAEARRLQKRSTDKVSRLKSRGVVVAGTEYDPRVPAADISSMTRRQVNAYMKRLSAFNDRGTQFVPGRRGAPIPRDVWVSFERAQQAVNIRADKALSRRGALVEPVRNVPVSQYVDSRDRGSFSLQRQMGAGIGNMPYPRSAMSSRDFESADSVRKFDRAMRGKLAPAYFRKKIASQRSSAYAMYEQVGQYGTADMLRSLTDEQFDTAWNFTSLPETAKFVYEAELNGFDVDYDTMNSEAGELILWARSL